MAHSIHQRSSILMFSMCFGSLNSLKSFVIDTNAYCYFVVVEAFI